ncbi:hypothetical protein PRNP1_010010 [Phytophthora ramorum]
MAEEAPRREACTRCGRPPRVCYCTSLPLELLATERAHVLVLQHTHEKRRRAAISSVPVMAQTLAHMTLVMVDDDCDCGPGMSAQLDALLYGGGDGSFDAVLVLFPDEDARPLSPASGVADTGKRVLLIVIDGTWKEAKKIARRNRSHWEKAACEWEARGASWQYICLDGEEGEAPTRSIYGDLRREPMEGCMSTLEAVASALVALEPKESGRRVHKALLQAFKGMVSIQEQFQQRGRITKLEQYGGISKQDAVEAKRLELRRHQQNVAAPTDRGIKQRAYVFYTTQTDFRHRQQLTQQGDVVTCTYDQARQRCIELNRDRKRGQRLALLPLDAFQKHLGQPHDA